MNLGKNLVDLATVPVRVGLAAAETGLDVANGALGLAQRSLNQANSTARGGTGSVAHMLGIDEAVERANRLARLMDEDQPLGRAPYLRHEFRVALREFRQPSVEDMSAQQTNLSNHFLEAISLFPSFPPVGRCVGHRG